jgi:hypothetical protein
VKKEAPFYGFTGIRYEYTALHPEIYERHQKDNTTDSINRDLIKILEDAVTYENSNYKMRKNVRANIIWLLKQQIDLVNVRELIYKKEIKDLEIKLIEAKMKVNFAEKIMHFIIDKKSLRSFKLFLKRNKKTNSIIRS